MGVSGRRSCAAEIAFHWKGEHWLGLGDLLDGLVHFVFENDVRALLAIVPVLNNHSTILQLPFHFTLRKPSFQLQGAVAAPKRAFKGMSRMLPRTC